MNKDKLAGILQIIQIGITKSETIIPGTQSIYFNNGVIASFNDKFCVKADCDVNVKGSVSGNDLIRLIKKIPLKDIELKDNKDSVVINYGKNEAMLYKIADTKVPNYVDTIFGKELLKQTLPPDFSQMLSVCMFPQGEHSKDGVYIVDNELYAIHGPNVARHIMPYSFHEIFWLPKEAVQTIIIISNTMQADTCAITATHFYLYGEGFSIAMRLRFASEFPYDTAKKYLDRFTPGKNTKRIHFPEETLVALDRVSTTAVKGAYEQYIVTMDMYKETIIRSDNGTSTIEEIIDIDNDDIPEVSCHIPVQYFKHMFGISPNMYFMQDDGMNMLVIATDSYKHLLKVTLEA